jgi:hypothetical protein
MTGLSIWNRVRRLQVSTGSSDPRELAEKLLAELTAAELRSALAEVLPEYVRQVMKSGRNKATAAPSQSSPSSPSWRVAPVRDWYEQLMAQPIDVSGGQGRWKSLRECTRDELLTVAQHRRETAARNVATAKKYEALARVLPASKSVGDLPADTVASVFGRAAA